MRDSRPARIVGTIVRTPTRCPPAALRLPAKLALEDGTVFTGASIGADGEVDGEVCFNTSMTGYQEILTDPSYRGQIVTMTYPQIGNYGVNDEDVESAPAAPGRVRRPRAQPRARATSAPSGVAERLSASSGASWRSSRSTPGRWCGACARRAPCKGVLSTVDLDDASLVAKAKASPGLVGRDLVREVMPDERRATGTRRLSEWTHLDGASRRRCRDRRRPQSARTSSPSTTA